MDPLSEKSSDHFHFFSWFFKNIKCYFTNKNVVVKTQSEKIRKGVQHIQIEKSKTKIRLCTQYKKALRPKDN